MKKILSVALAMALALSMAAMGFATEDNTPPAESPVVTAPEETAVLTATFRAIGLYSIENNAGTGLGTASDPLTFVLSASDEDWSAVYAEDDDRAGAISGLLGEAAYNDFELTFEAAEIGENGEYKAAKYVAIYDGENVRTTSSMTNYAIPKETIHDFSVEVKKESGWEALELTEATIGAQIKTALNLEENVTAADYGTKFRFVPARMNGQVKKYTVTFYEETDGEGETKVAGDQVGEVFHIAVQYGEAGSNKGGSSSNTPSAAETATTEARSEASSAASSVKSIAADIANLVGELPAVKAGSSDAAKLEALCKQAGLKTAAVTVSGQKSVVPVLSLDLVKMEGKLSASINDAVAGTALYLQFVGTDGNTYFVPASTLKKSAPNRVFFPENYLIKIAIKK